MDQLLGTFNSEAVAVSTTPVLLRGVAAGRPTMQRLRLIIGNGSTAVFIGGPNVTTANGLPLAANEKITLFAVDGVWAVAAGAATVSILEGF